MKILISGALGHMGRAVAEQCAAEGLEVVGGVDVTAGEAGFPVVTSFEEAPEADVVIDFSKPAALDGLLAYVVKRHIPAVLATTGYTEEQLAAIDQASREAALFRSGNMSLGIALLRALSRKAAEVLGGGFDVEIVEAHHNRKDAYGEPREAVCGRHGRDCRRQHQEIGIHSLRGGTVTGEHEVHFLGVSERIRISHSAENRSVFAAGAVRAAAFLLGKEPGLYSMDDVVGKL